MVKDIIKAIIGQQNVVKLSQWRCRRAMAKYGEESIAKFHDVANTHQLDYWLAFGTLLGAYREKGFITGDDDIDTGMFCTEITPAFINDLIKAGFKYEHTIMTDDCMYSQMSFNYHGVPFDIYGFRHSSENKDVLIKGFIPRALHGKDWGESFEKNKFKILIVKMDFGGVTMIDFLNSKTYIPQMTETFLKNHYGDDFMTPMPGKKGSSKKTLEELSIEEHTASLVTLNDLFVKLKH